MTKTASLYVRRSKASVDGETVSLAFQQEDLRRLAAQHGAEVVKVFVDDGASGANLNRRAWLQWIDSAKDVDLLLTWAIDRSARGNAVMSLYPLMSALSAHGARLITVRDRIDSEDPRFERDVLWEAQRAGEDWKTISARNKRTAEAMKARGEHSGIVPFGTRVEDKKLVIDEEEAAIIREAASRILRGDSTAAVTRWLNSTGHVTRRGNTWERQSMLRNIESKAVRRLGILDLATLEAVYAKSHPLEGTGQAGRPRGGRPPVGLLSGLAICASCRRRLYHYRFKRQRSAPVYRCATRGLGKPCDEPGIIKVEMADAFIEDGILSEPIRSAFWWEETVQIVGGNQEEARRRLEDAKAALLAEMTIDNLKAAQEAEEGFRTATPGERRRTLVPTEPYGERWIRANATRGEEETPAQRDLRLDLTRSLICSVASEVRIGRHAIEVDWRHLDDPRTND